MPRLVEQVRNLKDVVSFRNGKAEDNGLAGNELIEDIARVAAGPQGIIAGLDGPLLSANQRDEFEDQPAGDDTLVLKD